MESKVLKTQPISTPLLSCLIIFFLLYFFPSQKLEALLHLSWTAHVTTPIIGEGSGPRVLLLHLTSRGFLSLSWTGRKFGKETGDTFFSIKFHQLMFVSTPNPLIWPALTDFAGATCESALSSHFSQSANLPLVTSSFTTPSPIQRGSLSLFHPHFMQFLTPIQFRLLFFPPLAAGAIHDASCTCVTMATCK